MDSSKTLSTRIGLEYNNLKVLDVQGNKFLCKCICGNEKWIRKYNVINGKTKSCGCMRSEYARQNCLNVLVEARRLPEGVAAIRKLLREYKSAAKQRDFQFELSEEEFLNITIQNCFYCGLVPSNVQESYHGCGTYTYNGIDRIDNALGYTIENSVPCCTPCNIAKRAMTETEFYLWADRLHKHLVATGRL